MDCLLRREGENKILGELLNNEKGTNIKLFEQKILLHPFVNSIAFHYHSSETENKRKKEKILS